jgi:hypothetical protein
MIQEGALPLLPRFPPALGAAAQALYPRPSSYPPICRPFPPQLPHQPPSPCCCPHYLPPHM